MSLDDIIDFLNNPKVVIISLFIFVLIFFLTDGFIEGFKKDFFTFGPTHDKDGKPVTFMGIELNSWKNVIITYIILFFTTIMSKYYDISSNKIKLIIYNSSSLGQLIPLSKKWTHILIATEPLIYYLIYIIRFYATATLQIQYILPQLIGTYFINIPYIVHWLRGKEFI